MGKRKQLLALSTDLSVATQHLKRLRNLEVSLVQSLGPLSYFSLLPVELLCYILDLVFLDEITTTAVTSKGRATKRFLSVFQFFLTCKTALDLRVAWCTQMYRKIGGVEQPKSPTLGFVSTLEDCT